MRRDLLLMTALGAIFLGESSGKPIEIAESPDVLDPVALTANYPLKTDATRRRRSPQFGLIGDYGDYYDNDNSRRFRLGHTRTFYKPHKPSGLLGCRFGCSGASQPAYQGGGGSFAAASAGSIGGGGGSPYGFYGGQSQANAQSASFNIGPYSATFSAAQASGRRQF